LGYTKQELLGKNSIILNHPDDYKKARRFMLKVFKYGENMHETRIRHKNGNWVWFENKAKMFTDEQGNQKYLYISRDITERKKTEKALKESEEKYRSLYKNSPNAVVLTNERGLILDINSSAERILGYKREEIIGRNYLEFNMVTYDQISTIKRMYKEILNGIKPKPIELQIKRKNSKISWISFQSSMIKIDKEIIIESICQDINSKKKAEILIIEENKRLMELNKIKSEFISRASHELKTPITSIYGGSQILMELYKDQTCSEAIEFIELINRGGKRLKLLVDNLLDASRIDSDKLRLNLQSENIAQIIQNSTNEIRYLAYKRNIIIEQHLPETANIVVDKIRIEQVITNLISNAIKNTPRKGIILLVLEEKPDSVIFKVKDSGIGLTEKEMEKLFTKFGKIERIGPKMDIDIEGSGLGLYISKEIVDLHGGQIWVESAGRNKGSAFYFKLFKK
jgi:PAS domain S-box-containing protein